MMAGPEPAYRRSIGLWEQARDELWRLVFLMVFTSARGRVMAVWAGLMPRAWRHGRITASYPQRAFCVALLPGRQGEGARA